MRARIVLRKDADGDLLTGLIWLVVVDAGVVLMRGNVEVPSERDYISLP
jgi:hypothetical protein